MRIWFPVDRTNQVILLAALALAIGVRVVLLIPAWGSEGSFLQPDSADYLAVAEGLPASVGLDPGRWMELSLRRTPGYPLMVGVMRAIPGIDLHGVVVAQVIVSVLTAYLVGLRGWLVLSGRVGAIAALVPAVDPAAAIHSSLLLSETLFAFLVVAMSVALVKATREMSRAWAASAGLLLALATLTRPVALLVPIAVVPAVWFFLRGEGSKQRPAAVLLLIFCFSFLLPVGTWMLRNNVVADVTTVSTIDGASLYLYKAAGAIAEETGEDLVTVQERLNEEASRALDSGATVADQNTFQKRRGIELLFQHKVGAVKTWAIGATKLLGGPAREPVMTRLCGSADECGLPGRVVLLGQLVTVVGTLCLAIAGVLLVASDQSRLLLVLLPIPVVLVAVSAAPEAYSRFRIPVLPFIAVFAACAVHALLGAGRDATGGAAPST